MKDFFCHLRYNTGKKKRDIFEFEFNKILVLSLLLSMYPYVDRNHTPNHNDINIQ